MARMIPGYLDERAPPGEQRVYGMFAAGPEDWVVVHSLDIAPWNRRHRTEIDFMVVIPDLGVLCVEVKSHDRIWVEDGVWYPTGSIKRSPFQQAVEARYALAKGLAQVWPYAGKIPFGQCCIFPTAHFALSGTVAVRTHELMDGRQFNSFASDLDRCAALKAMFRAQLHEGAGQRLLTAPLNPAIIENLLDACLPVRKRLPTARQELERREEAAVAALREQQRPVLQLFDHNERLVVTGGAGTGKTHIALELARRAASRGQRVALLCFNTLVGDWLNRQGAVVGLPNLVVGRAWKVMAELAGVRIPSAASQSYWEQELPDLLEERLTDPGFTATAQFDLLVLDEAQDVLARPRMWDCLQQFIDGGLAGGKYVILGDFAGQVVSGQVDPSTALQGLMHEGRATRWVLSENCRNYRVVGDAAVKLSGLSIDTYTGYRRESGSIPLNYDPLFYTSEAEQVQLAERCLQEATRDGFKPSDITLLSMRADEHSVAETLRMRGHRIYPCREGREGISSCSIHAFKGLENRVIVVTDIHLQGHPNEPDLFYVALTRATERVRLLSSEESKATFLAWLQGRPNT